MERKDLIVKAKELGYTKAHSMKTVELEVIVSSVKEKKSFIGIKTGRPVNASSKRQQRLAELNAKIEAGVTIKKGRPVVEDSVRQLKLKELETKRANGELKLGRRVDSSSKRQLRITELEAKRTNGELRRGRPKKQSDDISLIDMLKTVHK
jgi:hypothetical protein